jgi:hypothetical protein
MTTEMREAIVTIEEFLDGTDDVWAWDDFLSVPPRDPLVTTIQGFCRQLRSDYPPTDRREYCSAEGKARLRSYIEEVRGLGATGRT